LACELRDDGESGTELQIYRDRESLLWPALGDPALALKEAEERKALYLRDGGVLIA
jgi:hypothetical protein